jgi:hypothetical protein
LALIKFLLEQINFGGVTLIELIFLMLFLLWLFCFSGWNFVFCLLFIFTFTVVFLFFFCRLSSLPAFEKQSLAGVLEKIVGGVGCFPSLNHFV